ncbi:DUF4403 family protein [Acinetobacter baumannii]|uniref:DUF4403 family protein n=1 Tax=Acinetobacter baumannii TaxID=470 RepID=UPI0011275736|nr:DUF4403 family protein [Acinetobacter baumannii]TPU39604.1 DUF4403 family protein [Acinetobacter baumannii]
MNILTKKALIIACITILTACSRDDLFEKPPEGGQDNLPKPLENSQVDLALKIPFSVIQKAIEQNIPSQQNFEGSGNEPCTNVPALRWAGPIPYPSSTQACAGNQWSASANKSGPVSVIKSGEEMQISVPITINGKAGLRGDLAGILSLSGKSFNASVEPTVNLKLGFDQNWCPQVKATARNNWVSSANVEIIGKNCASINLGPLGDHGFCAGPVGLDLTNYANDALNSQKDQILSAASKALDCNQIQQSIQEQWKPIVIPVNLDGQKPLYLNITPNSLAFSNIQVDNDSINFKASAKAKTEIGEKPAEKKIIPLPPLETLSENNGESNLKILLRANISYEKITDSVKKMLNDKNFENQTPVGKVSVKVNDIEVFPSNGKIAIGIKISANLPKHFSDAHGWVYLTTVPSIDPSGTKIKFNNLKYSTVLDEKLWKTIVFIFDKQILKELQKNSQIDLNPILSKNSKELIQKINSTKITGVELNAEEPTAKLLEVTVGSKMLIATALAEMKFAVTLNNDVITSAPPTS